MVGWWHFMYCSCYDAVVELINYTVQQYIWQYSQCVPQIEPSFFLWSYPVTDRTAQRKQRLIENQYKCRWCHYSIAITLCNHHDELKQKTCVFPLLVEIKRSYMWRWRWTDKKSDGETVWKQDKVKTDREEKKDRKLDWGAIKREKGRERRDIDCDFSDLWGRTQERQIFFSSGPIQPNPRNPIMSEKPLMSPITPRASLSFNPFLQHIVNISRGSVTQSDYQCPYKAEMFCRPSVLKC